MLEVKKTSSNLPEFFSINSTWKHIEKYARLYKSFFTVFEIFLKNLK